MKCKDFVERIKVEFDYLFDIYGFSHVYTHVELERTGYCLMGLENSVCRIIIYKTWSEGNVWIGSVDAPFSWELKGYYSVKSLLMFILGKDFQLPDYNSFPSIEEQLSASSQELKPYLNEVINLFSEDLFERWQVSYADFQEKQKKVILRRFGSKK